MRYDPERLHVGFTVAGTLQAQGCTKQISGTIGLPPGYSCSFVSLVACPSSATVPSARPDYLYVYSKSCFDPANTLLLFIIDLASTSGHLR